ncbi:MAG TPA: hypothetical protein VIW70_09990 [Rubrivivax sp.]
MQSLAALVISAAAAAASSPPPARAPTAQPTQTVPGEPTVQRRVAEDDNVRIEETRVRGESQRIVVKPKTAGAKEYEIEPSTGANDPSQRNRRAAGERVWRIFNF